MDQNISLKCGLTNELIIQLIKNIYTNFKEINSIREEPATAHGENFCSFLYRVYIEFSNGNYNKETIIEKKSFVVKTMLQSNIGEALLNDLNVFNKEIMMYEHILPKINENCFFPYAKCLLTSSIDKCKLIVFDDLKVGDYHMANRQNGLDQIHAKLVIKNIAKFHASSFLLALKEPKVMDIFEHGIFNPKPVAKEILTVLFGKGLNALINVVSTWNDEYKILTEKLKNLEPKFIDMIYECVAVSNDKIKVLNHGDFWVNNFMFKYDLTNKNLLDVIFVDYQMSFFASPGVDINYFMYTSVQTEVREQLFEELLKLYYYTFSKILNSFQVNNVPSFDDIKQEIKRKEFYGFTAAVGILPLVLKDNSENEESFGLDTYVDEDNDGEARNMAYNGKNYQNAMMSILKYFDSQKLFD